MLLSNTQRGELAEAVVRAEFKRQGWEVAILDSHNPRYDMAIHRDKDEGWLKVQIKFARLVKNVPKADLRREQGKVKVRYTPDEIDYFAIWCGETDETWLIPIDEVAENSSISLNNPKFKQYRLERNNVW